MLVLIAEDDPQSRYLLETILRSQGHEVVPVSNGKDALDLLHREPVDLIISDLLMPKMDGYQLLRECKTDDRLKSIPFIVYTATYTGEKDIQLARDLGAYRVLLKPLEPDEFMAVLKPLIEKAPKADSTEPEISADEKERYLQEHADRLIAKLDKKITDLETQTRKNTHLNRLLRAIRLTNQMMIRERDPVHLLERACDILTQETGYLGVWILLYGGDGTVDLARTAGSVEGLDEYIARIDAGKEPPCFRRAISGSGVVVIGPKEHESGCPTGARSSGMQTMATAMRTDGRLIGMIGAHLPPGAVADADEISLFEEIAGDIGYALNALWVEEAGIAARRAQKESENKYQRLFNNLDDAVFLHELTEDRLPGRILEVNDAACSTLGYTREELLDASILDINTPTDREQAPELVGTLLEKRHATFEGFNRRRDGSVFPVEVAAHLFSMDGRPRVLAIARDITERKELEKRIRDALRQIEANMGQLATLNDHIRNPLTVIVASADMAPGEVRDTIVAHSEEIDRIIQRLDQGYLESEKVWQFLRRHYGFGGGDDDKETAPDPPSA